MLIAAGHPGIPVLAVDAERWRARLAEAHGQGLEAYERYYNADHGRSGYQVVSGGNVYRVDYWTEGPQVRCNCAAGIYGMPCKHAALVVDIECGWPGSLGITVQPEAMPAWRAQLDYAYQDRIRAELAERLPGERAYTVRQGRDTYTVRWWPRELRVQCDCPEGRDGEPCKHAAWVIATEAGWPTYAGDAPRQELARGTRVLILAGSLRGCVGHVGAFRSNDEVGAPAYWPMYRVDDLTTGTTIGAFESVDLEVLP